MQQRGGRVRGLMSAFALAAAIVLVSALPAAAQTLPVEPPLAASSNVHPLGHIPGSAAGMVFRDHYAYVSGWTGVTVLDIADADSPQVVGELPLPHFENEDVDACGDTLIVVNDRAEFDIGSVMYVVDIANRTVPTVRGVLQLGLSGGTGRGSGHIANFVKTDCTQAWVDGGDHVEVVDLTFPSAPRSLGKFESAASHSDFNITHDTELDSTGTLWSVGGGGAAGYRLTDNPLAPQLLGTTGAAGANPSPYNDFILHNSQRRGKTLLITEEDYVDLDAEPAPGGCRGQGKFETWDLSRLNRGAITPVDTWETELNGMFTSGAVDSKAPVTVNCSSHWFDAKDGVAAVGWYEQGVRFLDYRTPTDIVQVGYYIPANGLTWAAYWSPTDTTGQIVYTADAYRGVDVLRIEGGGLTGKKVKAPVRNEWFGSPTSDAASFQAHPDYGFMCPVLQAGVDLP